ncbi:glycosyltransferase family 25 protein [Pigmentiphaga sp.]|uniref:glycosyltransferase family 25 protein n=1 Tax=Pigmentiphaga sp. TaxID=1977564 RepID=UPI0025F5071F|nr:glycosyltransferase family 25 protein [Pigmentiphaga sp.]
MMPVYVINLERAAARRERIGAQLDRLGLPYALCQAVEGAKLDAQAVSALYDEAAAARDYRPLSRGELGCALSHLAVYQRMLDEGADYALVLEDDAAPGEEVPRVLGELERVLDPASPTIVLLSHIDKYTRWGRRPLGAQAHLVRRYGHWWLAHGYVVTRAAAERMLAALRPVWSAADFWAGFERRGIVRVQAVVPCCVGLTELARTSFLEGGRVDLDTAEKSRRSVGYYFKRYLYQRFLHQILVRPFLRVARQRPPSQPPA